MIALILESAVRSFLLGLAVWIALAIFRARDAHIEKMVWTVVLVVSAVMPIILAAPVAPLVHAPEYALIVQAGDRFKRASTSASAVVPILYVTIVSLLLLRSIVSFFRTWLVRRTARRMNDAWTSGVDVRVSPKIQTPATFGSTILLPANFMQWSDQMLAAVIAHERAHVMQRDCYILWLARMYCCVVWFNPFAWFIQWRLALLAEITSDDAVLATPIDRASYASILLEFAKVQSTGDFAVPMARRKISARIERVIDGVALSGVPKFSRRIFAFVALLPMIALAAVPLQSSSRSDNEGPRVISWPTLAELMNYYPREAKLSGTEGAVEISVTLDAQGRPTDTLILSEHPLDKGFGAAASALAHEIKYENPTHRTTQLSVRMKFALRKDADTESAESPDSK